MAHLKSLLVHSIHNLPSSVPYPLTGDRDTPDAGRCLRHPNLGPSVSSLHYQSLGSGAAPPILPVSTHFHAEVLSYMLVIGQN